MTGNQTVCFSQELLVELGWASKEPERGEEDRGGSVQTKDGGSGEDCDDEDGCETSGQESGESHVCTNTPRPAGEQRQTHTCLHASPRAKEFPVPTPQTH